MAEHNYEQAGTDYLQCCMLDGDYIDRGIADGVVAEAFTRGEQQVQWAILCELRVANKPTDPTSVYAHAMETGRLERAGGLAGIAPPSGGATSINGAANLSIVLAGHQRRSAWKLLHRATELVEGGTAEMSEVGKIAEDLSSVCAGRKVLNRPIKEIASEAEAEAEAAIGGVQDERITVTTGLHGFDRRATPMYPHEYVVVGGRSSHGKSSLLNQIVGHNLSRGLRVVIFTLETSDKSVVKQLAGQRAGVDLRNLRDEPVDRQQKYLGALRWLKDCKNLLVFDRDLSLEAVTARCRLLAQSFKPNLVVVDYLGLLTGDGDTMYQRTATASKAMIPLQKMLGCVLMAGCQLNQESEKDKREPGRTDFRDAGTILDDAHRVIQVWRKPDQFLDQQYYDCELLQVKLRDGCLTKVPLKFNAPTTKFFEESAA